jgi:large subunit ribosomal protein L21
MYAIVQTGGKQYKVLEGSTIKVEKLDINVGETVEFKPLVVMNENGLVTPPSVNSFNVKAKILRHGRGKKLSVYFYRNKTNQHRRLGHRQEFTELQIEQIS